MEFEEHEKLREYDLKVLSKRHSLKLVFLQEVQKLKLQYLSELERVWDKRHVQRLEYLQQGLKVFEERKKLTD